MWIHWTVTYRTANCNKYELRAITRTMMWCVMLTAICLEREDALGGEGGERERERERDASLTALYIIVD